MEEDLVIDLGIVASDNDAYFVSGTTGELTTITSVTCRSWVTGMNISVAGSSFSVSGDAQYHLDQSITFNRYVYVSGKLNSIAPETKQHFKFVPVSSGDTLGRIDLTNFTPDPRTEIEVWFDISYIQESEEEGVDDKEKSATAFFIINQNFDSGKRMMLEKLRT